MSTRISDTKPELSWHLNNRFEFIITIPELLHYGIF